MKLHVLGCNSLWIGVNSLGYMRYRAALGGVERIQESLLADYLRRNANTAFGRRFRFAEIRSRRDYQRRVPLSTYDDYIPYVERVASGEGNVLTTEPVSLFEPSSGSTRPAKWIPYTATLQAEFRRAVAPWISDLLLHRPRLACGPAYWSITPMAPAATGPSSVIPVGFETDSAYLGGLSARLVDHTLVGSERLRSLHDLEQFRHVTLLFLLAARELRMISVWHPAFLTLLLDTLSRDWERLIEHLRDGLRVREAGIVLPRNSRRARELAALSAPEPLCIWPRIGLISCWADGHAALHLDRLRSRFPGVEIQAKGIIATEAFVSLPFEGVQPLAVCSHFFEFLDDRGVARIAWDLEPDGEYELVLTTGGGLYRYRLQDRVRVTGFLGQAPCLRFVGKTDRISDLFGEKLSEGFVAGVLDRVARHLGEKPKFALLAPETGGGQPRYVLFLETPSGPPDGLAAALEDGLRENPGYEYCVRLGQLSTSEVACVQKGACERYLDHLGSHGQRLGSVKPSVLSPFTGWRAVLGKAEPATDYSREGVVP